MPDSENRNEFNVPGKFYIDDNCIICEMCAGIAPDTFALNHDEATAFVFKQPENSEQQRLAEEAMEECPVEAIGDDG